MQFEKQVLVLKQTAEGYSSGKSPVGGILRIENENGVCTMFLSLINLSTVSFGSFNLFVLDGNGELIKTDLGKRVTSVRKTLDKAPSLSDGISAGISVIKDDLPVLIAYASSLEGGSVQQFKKAVADFCYGAYKIKKKTPVAEYNDEAVATENYFELENDIEQKINEIAEKENEFLSDNNRYADSGNEKKKKKTEEQTFRNADETDMRYGKECDGKPYFDKVKKELNDIFERFPNDITLERCFPKSRWARITYSQNKFYVVGVIKEDDREKYVCYGIPSTYSEDAPRELAGYCSFLPLSVFDLKGDGYWMMFQDAITGECIKKSAL